MNLEIKTLDQNIKEIKLTGRLDMQGALAVDSQFTSHTSTQKAGVLVDLSGVEFIASIGMRLLLTNAKALSKRGGKMILLNPTTLVRDALLTAGFEQLIPIFDDYQMAFSELSAALRTDGT